MNTGYAKEIILNSFYNIVKENLLHNFVYEEDKGEAVPIAYRFLIFSANGRNDSPS